MTAVLLKALALALSLAAVSPTPQQSSIPVPVYRAVAQAVQAPAGARMQVGNYRAAPGCVPERAQVARRLQGSGTVSVQVQGKSGSGATCRGWAWVSVRLFAPVWVASRAVPAGTPLAQGGAQSGVEQQEREVLSYHHPIAELPSGARAAEPLAPGMLLEPRHLRVGPLPGESAAVVVQSGSIKVERVGRVLACGSSTSRRACAMLEDGSRMEGTWQDGRIQVVLP